MRRNNNRNTWEDNPEKNIFIFDVDGTLTPPNKPMDIQFMRWFELWMLKPSISVVFCTNNTFESISERMGRKIIEQSRAVFTCGGNEVYTNKKKIALNNWRPTPELIQFLDQVVKKSEFKTRSGPNFEYRTGMVSFSVLGKTANDEDREKYKRWDQQTKERIRTVKLLKEKFPDLCICKSGDTSIDISNGDKSQILKYFTDTQNLWFFGNEFEMDGNDISIKLSLEKNNNRRYTIKHVHNDQETFSTLRKLTI